MLDLGLGHLGIEVGEAVNESELNAVVKACGDSKFFIRRGTSSSDLTVRHQCCPNWMLVTALVINHPF